MKKNTLSLYFLFLIVNCFSQDKKDFFYNETCYNIAKKYHSDKNVEKYFRIKGELQPKDYLYYYDIAYYFLERKKFEKAYKYMSKAIKCGLSFEMTRNFEIAEFDIKHQKLIQKNFLKNRNKTISYFYVHGTGDLQKFQFMKDLLTADQTARYQLDFTGYKNKGAWKYIEQIDSLNLDTLIKFIKCYGMVNNSNVGGDAIMSILFLHLKRYDNPYLDSCIKDNCFKHLLHTDAYTFSIDEKQEKGSSIYGTLGVTDTTLFLNLNDVDSRRNSVGLPSLYEQALYQNFKLPNEYIVPENISRKYIHYLKEIDKEKSLK